MKQTLFIALLGTTIALTIPSLSFADSSYKFSSSGIYTTNDRHQYRNNHKKFVPKPPKPRQIIKQIKRERNKIRRQNRRFIKNDRDYRHYNQYKRHNRYNDSSFSITWNDGDSNITYDNTDYNAYNTAPRRNQGKRIYKRIHNQANRIQQGIESGQLVRREVRKLRRQHRHIKHTLSDYKRDGYLNRYERAKMNQLLDVASNNIYREKHNRLTRYSRNND